MYPKEIELLSDKVVQIIWDDGHESIYFADHTCAFIVPALPAKKSAMRAKIHGRTKLSSNRQRMSLLSRGK